MNDAYAGLEPIELWRHFDALNTIPRLSGHEAAARAYVERIAQQAGCTTRTDAYGNCVVYVPARGSESLPPVCVQAHLDMVPATAPGVIHNFETDPIVPRREGDRITATGTTLGADNGIGAAAALALITDTTVTTGPLELLFTVEEETGLKGAAALDGSLLSAKSLINLDSEDPTTLTIGCAGGETLNITLPISRASLPVGFVTQVVRVGGLKGGHSGIEINERRANAIKLLAAILTDVRSAGIAFELAHFEGGSAHNAIPRSAFASLALPSDATVALANIVQKHIEQERATWGDSEPDLAITVDAAPNSDEIVVTPSLIELLYSLPTGVAQMSAVFPGKVQTSDNVATVRTGSDAINITVSIRSFVAADIADMQDKVEALVKAAGGSVSIESKYPSWEPNPDSKLQQIVTEAFVSQMGKAPSVEVIHAGLECGVISAKVPGMEAISFGPSITGAHTPEEAVYPESVEVIWKLLVEVLRRL